MEQIELAKRSRVAVGTIRRMESFDEEVGARTSTLSQVQKALEKAGVEFLNDGQPGVRLKRSTGNLGGHPKTGHLWSLQNRPLWMA